MRKKHSSWKQKIDPSFPKIIKLALKSLTSVDMPSSSGWLVMEPYYLKKLEQKGFQGWIRDYEKKITGSVIKDISLKKMNTEEIKKHNKDICRELRTKIQILPEESQEYYKRVFKSCFSKRQKHEVKLSKSQQKTYLRNYLIDYFALEFLSSTIKMDREMERDSVGNFQKKFNRPKVIIDLIMNYYNSASMLAHKKKFHELMREGKGGDQDAFFKLLQIDRTVIELEWAQKMVRRAQLTGDEKFFKRMAKAIVTSPLENTKLHGELLIVLLMLWQYGLDRLTNNELIDLLESSGLKIQDSPETFRKFVTRQIRPTFKKHFIQII
jgi:hypothetical protein